eukprot:9907923-Alexandrium_andersonii.AAC.1
MVLLRRGVARSKRCRMLLMSATSSSVLAAAVRSSANRASVAAGATAAMWRAGAKSSASVPNIASGSPPRGVEPGDCAGQ